jgi:hypothetical protein
MVLLAVGATRAQQTMGNEVYSDIYKEYTDDPDMRIHTSNIDYTELASQITAGCTDRYQSIRAIYEWVCKNIDYDLSLSIHRADSCLLMRKGVCQAYCELFYQIAKAVDIRVEPINGYSKDIDGRIQKEGHTWLFAYTQEKRGILLDPTWGAGRIEEGRYVKDENCWTWFNVEPEWMLLSHYPNLEVYQLIDQPITMEDFHDLPIPHPLWREYGLNMKDIFNSLRGHQTLALPIFYNRGEGQFKIVDIPMCDSLTIGQEYTFRIQMLNDREFIIRNNRVYNQKNDWQSEGNGVYSINFMPRDTVKLTLGLKDLVRANYWNTMLEYRIKPPTVMDWARVEKKYPLCVPDARAVGDIDSEAWKEAGIDGHRLLQIIREQKIKELPTIYREKGQKLKIVKAPMNKQIKAGEKYTFQFRPESGLEWAITNEGDWYRDWEIVDGVYYMTVTPKKTGMMMLCVKMPSDKSKFFSCLMYDVIR